MKKTLLGGLTAGAVACGIAVSRPASAVGSVGDQSGTAFAAELNAAAPNDGLPDTTAAQARNIALLLCAQRRGGLSEAEIITQMTGPQQPHQYAVVMVKGAEFHFCPEFAGAS